MPPLIVSRARRCAIRCRKKSCASGNVKRPAIAALNKLAGKLDGKAIRVPTPNVSVVDLTVNVEKSTTAEEVNAALTNAANGPLENVLQVITDKVVSADMNHDPHSSSAVMDQTVVMGGNLVRVLSWYDNEWGFSCRMLDTAAHMSKFL